MEVSGQLTPGERDPQYPLNTSLHRPQSWSGNFGEENNLLPLLGKTHNSPAHRPVLPCNRPPQHRFFLVSLCLQANAEMIPNFPSCYYMLLM